MANHNERPSSISAADFDALVARSFKDLPEIYRDACRGLGIRTEPQASKEILSALGVADPNGLLGLYHGINLTQKSVFDLPSLPDEVILYRDPILACANATRRPLAELVAHVLVHEIGHHFGFSDADMDLIERS
ncbi:MAG: metallopeptidase family protein [Hyphomicrobiaceae bacterium]